MFENSFPKFLFDDVSSTASTISTKVACHDGRGQTEFSCNYLINGENISFPSRIYYTDALEKDMSRLSSIQQLIYHCVFSRHHNGFTREKHINALLSSDELPYWTFPYIIKICDEYVIKILECVYDNLYQRNNNELKLFCVENLTSFCVSHDRMVSYWNEYYRHRNGSYTYKNYIGRKLFHDCFGYTYSMEKLPRK